MKKHIIYGMPDELFHSKLLPGAVLNDWSKKDFTVSMQIWDTPSAAYIQHSTFDVLDVQKAIKPKGKAAKVGNHGYLMMAFHFP